ncbi:MAG: FAD-binding protein [Bifidobacteriaceae bacterium]|jgi:fumarate reductase flavoprotein subunit|nr:FAD-binding protein [Bifidobacteriaceae bacterium]
MAKNKGLPRLEGANQSVSRRAFLGGSVAVGGVAALAGLAACTGRTPDSNSSGSGTGNETGGPASAQPGSGLAEAEETIETEVLIVGAGAAGMMAAYEAAIAGAKVTVISNSPDAVSTNGSMVSGTSAVDTTYTREYGQTDVTTDDLFKVMYAFSHGMINARLLKSCIAMQPGNIELFDEMGIAMNIGADRYDSGIINVHLFGTEGKGQIMQDFITARGDVTFVYNTEGTEPLMEGQTCVGIKAESDGKVIDYKAKAVILACGGYVANAERLKAKFGCEIVPLATPYQTGKGIDIAEAAGAFRENVDCLGLSDVVGANMTNGFNLFNPICMPAMYGGLLVAPDGRRFFNEYDLAMASMSYGGEPLIHVKQYYAVLDEAAMKSHTEPGGYYGYMGNPACWVSGSLLYSQPIDGFDDLLAQAMDAGWAFKFDSVASAASSLSLAGLEETVTEYNAICAAGNDTQFFKRPEMLKAIDTSGAIYVLQYNPGAFNTAGGCRTDEFCRALTSEFEPIPGLYIAGVENGSLYGRPYFVVGGNMSGLAYSSGRLSGQQAASFVKA